MEETAPSFTLLTSGFEFQAGSTDDTDSSTPHPEGSQQPVPENPAISSCWKRKTEGGTFLEDVKEHINEFIRASMDERKACFKKTLQKMFGI